MFFNVTRNAITRMQHALLSTSTIEQQKKLRKYYKKFSNTNEIKRRIAMARQKAVELTTIWKDIKRAVLPQRNRAMPQVFFSVEVRQQHSLQV